MKFKIICSPQTRGSVTKKFISSSLAVGFLFNTTLPSLASTLSEDGRYESFEGNNITIDNVLEEDTVDVEIEGNTMVNVANQKDPVPITKAYTVEGTNHVPLQGDYDGKARPVIRGNTLVNLAQIEDFTMTTDLNSKGNDTIHELKAGTYTIMVDVKDNTLDASIKVAFRYIDDTILYPNTTGIIVPVGTNGRGCMKVNFEQDVKYFRVYNDTSTKGSANIFNIMLFKGDLTQNPPTEYIEGLESSFEDQLVTQEMVNSGQEKAENLGKYKVEYKVTGKNKLNPEWLPDILKSDSITNGVSISINNGKISQSGVATATLTTFGDNIIDCLEDGVEYIKNSIPGFGLEIKTINDENIYPNKNPFTVNKASMKQIRFYYQLIQGEHYSSDNAIPQLEEGSVATEYEPYKESTQTLYLNSPLLEGDTIENIDGKATHVKRSAEVILDGSEDENWAYNHSGEGYFTYYTRLSNFDTRLTPVIISDNFAYIGGASTIFLPSQGFKVQPSYSNVLYLCLNSLASVTEVKQWLSENPTTVVYELAEPIYETISDEPLIIDSYANGHLDLNSNIPVNKVDFKGASTELNYLYPDTEYTVQFESDNTGKLDNLLLGDSTLYSDYTVSKGINRLNITTPTEITSTELLFDGIGFNLSNLVVTERTDEYFDYFEGIQSVGQDDINGDNIEMVSNNKNLLNDKMRENWSEEVALEYDGNDGVVEKYLYSNHEGIKVEPNTKYTFSLLMKGSPNLYSSEIFILEYRNKPIDIYMNGYCKINRIAVDSSSIQDFSRKELTITTGSDTRYIALRFDNNGTTDGNASTVYCKEFSLTIGNSVYYEKHQSNSIQIPLSEPLRSLPNGVKDRIIKRNGQWVVERNVGTKILDGSEEWDYPTMDIDETLGFLQYYTTAFVDENINVYKNIYSDKLPNDIGSYNVPNEAIMSGWVSKNIHIRVSASRLKGNSLNDFREWLSNNPVTTFYTLRNSIYEPLNIDPTITLYEDVTHISNNSNIPANMKVTVDRAMNRAVEAIELAKTSPTMENLSLARMWTNLIKESAKKDELQGEIDDITDIEDLELERKSVTANMDVYIKSANALSMSLSTNNVTFEGYSGTEDLEQLNAVDVIVSSSLPYDLNAYLEESLHNSDKSSIMSPTVVNIKESSNPSYNQFINNTDKVVLKNDCEAINNKSHSIDLKLASDDTHKADVYKAVIKFEAVQK